MANNKSYKKNKASEGTAQADAQMRVIWDDSNMRSVYANVARVVGGREEIVLLFGMNPALNAAQAEVKIQLTDRITLNPVAAKRLSILLNNVLWDYQRRYKSLPIEPRKQETPAIRTRPFSETKRKDHTARLPIELLNSLNIDYHFERSFKVFEKTILANRFLLGFKKDTVREKPHEKVREICMRMNMPADLLEVFERHIPDADYIHFGFEENERTCIYKVYLEFYEKIEKEMKSRRNASDRSLMHLGFKWDALDNTRRNLTNYTWHPFLSVDTMVKKLSDILVSDQNRTTLELAKGILGVASQKIPHNDILYLEVTEKDNPRESFDINIYRANLQLSELYPFLVEMCQNYKIPGEKFHALYDTVKTRICGHLSGGVDRDGKDFFTVYYGVKGITEYGYTSGPPVIETPLTVRKIQATPSRQKLFFPRVERTDEKAGKLYKGVNSLNVQVGFERSFKILEKTLLTDRFLMGFKKRSIKQKPLDSIVNICRQIDMPENFLDTFQEYLPESNIVLFGFEKNERTCVYKAYLEFGRRIEKSIKDNPNRPEPVLIHLGFKWDTSDNSKRTMARYTCFPSFPAENMLERLSNVFYSHKHKNPFEIAEGILNLALSRADPDEFLYFEAQEENNPRRSFDINMYRANLRLTELYPLLLKMCRHYAISSEEFHSLYDPVKTQIFGHLSGGVDREGRDFLTVYFGEKGSTR